MTKPVDDPNFRTPNGGARPPTSDEHKNAPKLDKAWLDALVEKLKKGKGNSA